MNNQYLWLNNPGNYEDPYKDHSTFAYETEEAMFQRPQHKEDSNLETYIKGKIIT